jgi:5-methylcytosine-specific restriction endonuclease McrA
VSWDDRPNARRGRKLPPRLRRKIIARDKASGAGCYFLFLDICTGLDGVVEVHHIIEVEDGGSDDEDNLRAACKNCHQRWSARQSQKRAVKAAWDWKRRKEDHPGVITDEHP